MRKIIITIILSVNVWSCIYKSNSDRTNLEKVVCSIGPKLKCIEINAEGKIKYADPALNNELDYESLMYKSYYVNQTSEKTFTNIVKPFVKLINDCKATVDGDINYLGATKMNVVVISKTDRKSYKIVVVDDICIDLMNSFFALFEISKFELVEEEVYFEGSREIFDVPPVLPH